LNFEEKALAQEQGVENGRGIESVPVKGQLSPVLRLSLELGPLVVFFFANQRFGIFSATLAFMVAMAVSILAMWLAARRVPIMPLVSGAVVMVFGGMTLYFSDETFIKLKPTIVNLLFAGALFAGLAMRRNLLPIVFDGVLQLNAEGWRKLSWRWAFFFVFLAGLNELLWRNVSTDVWVAFKVWGVMPLTFLFALAQMPLIMRESSEETSAGSN